MHTPDDDAAVLGTVTMPVAFRGETLTVSPLTLRQAGPFITASRPLIGRVIAAVLYAQPGTAITTATLLLDMIEQDGEALAAALSIITGKPADWIAGGTLDEITELAATVVGLNRDFFARRLPGLLQQARQALPEEMTAPAPVGLTSSSTSSSTATATTKH